MTYKTSSTIRPYIVTNYRDCYPGGYSFVIPTGSQVHNKTACGYDDNYRFWTDFENIARKTTGFDNSTLLHDLIHYGVNIPSKYCNPYESKKIMEYKIGDKVKIAASECVLGKCINSLETKPITPDGCVITKTMLSMCDKIVTINRIDRYPTRYHIKEDQGLYSWPTECFNNEKLNKHAKPRKKIFNLRAMENNHDV